MSVSDCIIMTGDKNPALLTSYNNKAQAMFTYMTLYLYCTSLMQISGLYIAHLSLIGRFPKKNHPTVKPTVKRVKLYEGVSLESGL